ncbi:MAG: hypothetical protein ABI556_14945 [Gemmatimonadales bacterium]
MKNAEDVVTAAFAAINAEDWHELAMLCDPASLSIFKRETLDLLSEYDDGFELENDFGDVPDLAEMLRFEMANVSSIEEAKAMDPGRVFARWIQAHSISYFSGKDDQEVACARRDGDRPRIVRSYKYAVLGSVADAPDIVDVIYRSTDPLSELYSIAYEKRLGKLSEDERRIVELIHHRDPLVVTCRKQRDGSWKIIAKRDFILIDSVEFV